MFHSDKKNMFVNHITLDKVDKKKESKTTPRVNTKKSAYDRVVQLVTNYNTEVKAPQEEQKKGTYECLQAYRFLGRFCCLKIIRLINSINRKCGRRCSTTRSICGNRKLCGRKNTI